MSRRSQSPKTELIVSQGDGVSGYDAVGLRPQVNTFRAHIARRLQLFGEVFSPIVLGDSQSRFAEPGSSRLGVAPILDWRRVRRMAVRADTEAASAGSSKKSFLSDYPHHVSPLAICARSQSSFRSRPRPGPSGRKHALAHNRFRTLSHFSLLPLKTPSVLHFEEVLRRSAHMHGRIESDQRTRPAVHAPSGCV